MTLPAALLIVKWMARETFRQSLASRIFWAMLLLSGLAIVFCLGIRVSGDPGLPTRPWEYRESLPAAEAARLGPDKLRQEGIDSPHSRLSLLFGAVTLSYNGYPDEGVRFLEVVLGGLVADTFGILLALIWTAGFLPTFLEARGAAVLLAKPVPRWALLLGKGLGVLAFLALQAAIFVLGTWLALTAATGLTDARYLFCIPLLVLHFTAFFSFSALVAVLTRSTVACILGSLAFWLACARVNYARILAVASGEGPSFARDLLEAGYWVLPKPFDLNLLLSDMLGADRFTAEFPQLRLALNQGAICFEATILLSVLFTLVLFLLAGKALCARDY